MSARNVHHDRVVRALIADGWTITHDPLTVTYGGENVYVDLGAERGTLAAEKGGRKIAVEIQSFLSPSTISDMHGAVGQYQIYRALLGETEPDRVLYLALPRRVQDGIISDPFGRLIVNSLSIRLLIFDEAQEGALRWIEPIATDPS